jgi:hypothetical protein
MKHDLRWPAIISAMFLLLVVFVTYRARTFHYCVEMGARPHSRLVGIDETCAPGEIPMEWQGLWREMGMRSKLGMLVSTTVDAFTGH